MRKSENLRNLLKEWEIAEKPLYAICAAPLVFKDHGLYRGRRLTSHPNSQAELESTYEYLEQGVVKSGPLLTSRGAGTAAEMAFEILSDLIGEELSYKIRQAMVFE